MTQQLPLVTKEQSIGLKEIGFSWPCEYYYFTDKYNPGLKPVPKKPERDYNFSIWGGKEYHSCPTVALALQWMWEVKGVYVYADYIPFIGNIRFYPIAFVDGKPINWDRESFDSPSLAQSAGLDAAIKYVKENGG